MLHHHHEVGALDQVLGRRVEPGRGLVQDHEPGIAQEDAGEGEQLPFTGREPGAAGFEHRLETVWQRAHPVAELETVDRVADACVRDRRVEEREVVAHRTGDQLDVLRDHADAMPQCRGAELAQVDAVELDRPLGRVIQPQQQPRERGLPATGAPEHAEHAAGRKPEVDVTEHRLAPVVRERHVRELDRGRAGGGALVRALVERRLHHEQLVHAPDRGGRALELLELIGDLLERTAQDLRVLEEEVDAADRHLSALVQHRGQREHEHVAEREQPGRERPQATAQDLGSTCRADQVAGYGERSLHHVRTGAVRADVINRPEPLLDEAVQVSGRLALGVHSGHGVGAGARNHEHGEHDERGEREADAPILDRQQHEHACEQQ